MENIKSKFDKYLLFFISYSVIFIVFFKTLPYTLPFVLGLICAIILQKPTTFLINKLKFKNSIASLISALTFFTIIFIFLTWGLASIVSELIDLTKNFQRYLSQNSNVITSYVYNLRKYFSNLDPTVIATLDKHLTNYITKAGNTTVAITKHIVSITINFITTIPYVIMVILFTLLSTYFFTKDFTNARTKFFSILSQENSTKFTYILKETRKMLSNYLLSYLLIISITFAETLVGFLILNVKYAVILSILSAFLDILPVLGIGSVYLPLAFFYFISKNYIVTIGIIILYILVSFARQILEPKIVSSSLGLHPVSVLAAIFIGLKANGISGMFFCMFLLVFFNILKKINVL